MRPAAAALVTSPLWARTGPRTYFASSAFGPATTMRSRSSVEAMHAVGSSPGPHVRRVASQVEDHGGTTSRTWRSCRAARRAIDAGEGEVAVCASPADAQPDAKTAPTRTRTSPRSRHVSGDSRRDDTPRDTGWTGVAVGSRMAAHRPPPVRQFPLAVTWKQATSYWETAVLLPFASEGVPSEPA
jgi:hypothetical protein